MPERLRVLERGERIRRLARLRNDDDQRVGIRHALTVAVLACDLCLRRQPGNRFEPKPRDHPRVIARAAGEHVHGVDVGQCFPGTFAE